MEKVLCGCRHRPINSKSWDKLYFIFWQSCQKEEEAVLDTLHAHVSEAVYPVYPGSFQHEGSQDE